MGHRTVALLMTLLAATGCLGPKDAGICGRGGEGSGAASSEVDVEAELSTAKSAWRERAEPGRLREAIEAWEQLIVADERRLEALLRLARAYHLLGTLRARGLGQGPTPAVAYRRGKRRAEQALDRLVPGFRGRVCSDQPVESIVALLPERAAPAAYWYAVNRMDHARVSSPVRMLDEREPVRRLLRFVRRVRPAYFHHGADRALGTWWMRFHYPEARPDRAAACFERALEGSPGNLATRVAYAEEVAIPRDDRALFERLLRPMVDGGAEAPSSPEDRLARERARELLDAVDVHFPGS